MKGLCESPEGVLREVCRGSLRSILGRASGGHPETMLAKVRSRLQGEEVRRVEVERGWLLRPPLKEIPEGVL